MSEPMLVTEVADGDRKRIVKLLVLGGIVLALALVLPKVLFGGGEDVPQDELFSSAATPTTVAPSAGDEAPVTEVVRAFSTRNPFTPLVAPAVAPATADPGVAVPVQEPAPTPPPIPVYPDLGSYPLEPPPPAAPPVTAPPTTTPPAPAPGDSRFALAEVFQDAAGQVMARVRINDVVHEVAVGRDFAEHYRFVSADLVTRCASFLYGDNRFELCEGEETRA